MALTLEIVRTARALEELTPQWWALWSLAPSATPFQTPAWLLPWWRAFTPGRLFTFVARHEGRLVGLAPFYVGADDRARSIGVSVSDYIDVLIDPARFDPVIDTLTRALQTEIADGPAQWEIGDLAPHAQAFALARTGALSCAEACPVLELPAGVRDVGAIVPARKRRKLQQARNRAERCGGVELLQASGADVPEAYRALVRLNGLRWRNHGGVLEDERVQRFHACAIPLLERAGMLDFSICSIHGRVVGAYFGMRDRTRAYAYLAGFDPDEAFISPGVLLVGRAVERAAREGLHEFHFLRGGERYKYQWGARDRMNSRLLIQARSRRDAA